MQLNPPLPDGYSPVPRGKIASVVTCLEMTAPPPRKPVRPMQRPLTVERWHAPDPADYLALYRAIGRDWMWFSRLVMPKDELAATLSHPGVEVYALKHRTESIGLLELDFRDPRQCELAFFGLTPAAIGSGAGRFLMDHAVATAWSRPIERFWVHTCTLDHPSAVGFYTRSGFTAFELMIEVADDPRLTGHLPAGASPQVPTIRPPAREE